MKASVLEFRLGEDIFCFNTKDIAYVFELEEFTLLDGVNPAIVGVVRYNQDVMPLVDTLYLYSHKHLVRQGEKSVVVIRDDEKNLYGMLVDEILKIEELDVVHPTVDMNSEDMVINHYRDKERIVNEIYPLLLLKKQHVVAMKQESSSFRIDEEQQHRYQEYLLFMIEKRYYALQSQYVKEVVEADNDVFELMTQNKELRGAIAVRDEVLSIAGLSSLESFDSVVIVESQHKKVAILVDEVFDIESFDTLKIEYLNEKSLAVNAFYNFQGSVVALINPEYFVQHIRDKNETLSNEEKKFATRQEYLTFRICDKRFAIDMKSVRQVVETEILSKTESSSIIANSDIKFITTWNKMAVSVADISHLVGIENFDPQESQTLFIQRKEHYMAFLVDEVEDIIYLSEHEVKKVSESDSIIGGAVLVEDDLLVKINEEFLVTLC